MAGHPDAIRDQHSVVPRSGIRILRDDAELAEASARAAESARRLRERLDARAAREAWTAEHPEQLAAWLRFVKGASEGLSERLPLVAAETLHSTWPAA